MLMRKHFSLLVAVASLGGCNGFFNDAPPVPTAGPTGTTSIVDTRAFVLPRCPVSRQSGEVAPLIGAVAGIVLPILIQKGLDFVSAGLKEAAGEKSVSSTAIANGNFYSQSPGALGLSLNARTRCIVVVRGVFGDDSPSFSAEEMRDAEIAQSLSDLGLVSDPHFYMEATIITSPEKSAFKLVSQRLIFNEPMNKDAFGLRKGSNKDVAVSFIFQTPAKSIEEGKKASFGGGALSFESLTPGKYLSEAALRGKETAWIPMPKIEAGKVKTARQSKSGQAMAFGPFSVVATITETRDASKVLQLISQVFEGSKGEAAKVIVNFVEETTEPKKKR